MPHVCVAPRKPLVLDSGDDKVTVVFTSTVNQRKFDDGETEVGLFARVHVEDSAGGRTLRAAAGDCFEAAGTVWTVAAVGDSPVFDGHGLHLVSPSAGGQVRIVDQRSLPADLRLLKPAWAEATWADEHGNVLDSKDGAAQIALVVFDKHGKPVHSAVGPAQRSA